MKLIDSRVTGVYNHLACSPAVISGGCPYSLWWTHQQSVLVMRFLVTKLHNNILVKTQFVVSMLRDGVGATNCLIIPESFLVIILKRISLSIIFGC